MDKLSALVTAHPELFRGKPPAVASELPGGWFDIVDALCRDIEDLLGPEPWRLDIQQIKEKFGGLRFYFSLDGFEDMFADLHADRGIRTLIAKADGPPLMDKIRELVAAASLRSTTTCEACGATGTRATRGGQVSTLCPQHADEAESQQASDDK